MYENVTWQMNFSIESGMKEHFLLTSLFVLILVLRILIHYRKLVLSPIEFAFATYALCPAYAPQSPKGSWARIVALWSESVPEIMYASLKLAFGRRSFLCAYE